MHHAYVYEGALTILPALVTSAREEFGQTGEHDPDVHARAFEKFGIGESRWLSGTAALKSASGHTLFVVGASSITTEAQQALLKLFEEPQAGVTFVLLVPHGSLLPTLRSRMLAYPHQLDAEPGMQKEARAFLAAAYKSRSESITKLLKQDEGNKERVRAFVDALEAQLYPKLGDMPQLHASLSDVQRVRSYLGDRSPSLKMLLEHLAATLPAVT